jgi:cobalt-zinc-cadmium efflux system membrane fusion protein
VVIPLSPESIGRAGLTFATATTASSAARLTLPGIVEANAYRQTAVTSVVGGRVTRVLVGLGDHVRREQAMVQVFSPELAEARARYVSARAELGAHEKELQRTERLVEIGAASRQELERIHAAHAAQTAMVQSARSRLALLGVPAADLDGAASRGEEASVTVRSPIDGIVTERVANDGLNVEAATKLLTVADLSSVWVVADLYEKDFSRVRVGTPAIVTTTAYPDVALRGRVSYIDPQVSAESRTAKVRVEVPNERGALRLGMYADVALSSDGPGTASIPKAAVQTIGNRDVVYVVNSSDPGKFVERAVRLGHSSADIVDVLSGLKAGERVVADGSFYVRAERERLGLPIPGKTAGAPSGASTQARTQQPQTARVNVGEQGFEPARVTLRAGIPARVTFLRTTDTTCAKEVVVPELKIRRALPLNEPVAIEFTPKKTGEIAFACGMNMLHGAIVVQ